MMAALLRRRRPPPRILDYTLGRSSLAAVAATVIDLLHDPHQLVVVQVSGFDDFDEDELAAINDLSTWSPRIHVRGLEDFAERLLPPPAVVDIRSHAERSVTHLAAVTVLTAVAGGRPLSDHELDAALQLALRAGRVIVTVDLREVEQLTPAQVLAIAEASGELYHDLRTMIIVNATSSVADQLRHAGLSSGTRIAVDER